MVDIKKYLEDVTPEMLGVLGGFIGTGFMGGLLVKKFPKITGWKAFFIRALAKFVVGVGLFELAERFTRAETLEEGVLKGFAGGAILSIFTDGIETFTHVRLQAGVPDITALGTGLFERKPKVGIPITSEGHKISGVV